MSPASVSRAEPSVGQKEARKQALFDIDLRIAPGRLAVLMGPFGSGKTTLPSCLRDEQDGSVPLLGHELHLAPPAVTTQLRRRVGVIFQAHNLQGSLTAAQNVIMGLQVKGRMERRPAAAAVVHPLDLPGLGDRAAYPPANLSGGQEQRVAIACALIGNPDVVLADEPAAALDRDRGANVMDLRTRRGRQRGTTTVMVTHDTPILDRADRILTLEDGRIGGDELRRS